MTKMASVNPEMRNEVVQWCRENCKGLWMVSDAAFSRNGNAYHFYFIDSDDAVLAVLRWSSVTGVMLQDWDPKSATIN